MFMIDHLTPEKADGEISKFYAMFPKGGVPAPMLLYSASPRYLLRQLAVLGDFMADGAYDHGFLAALRYIGASTACFKDCMVFNHGYLQSVGLTEDEIEALNTDPAKTFDPKEAALLALAAKATKTPDDVTKADVDAVRAQGWTDAQIFECTAYAANMATIGTVTRTFAEK